MNLICQNTKNGQFYKTRCSLNNTSNTAHGAENSWKNFRRTVAKTVIPVLWVLRRHNMSADQIGAVLLLILFAVFVIAIVDEANRD